MRIKNIHNRTPFRISGVIIHPGQTRSIDDKIWKKYISNACGKYYAEKYLKEVKEVAHKPALRTKRKKKVEKLSDEVARDSKAQLELSFNEVVKCTPVTIDS